MAGFLDWVIGGVKQDANAFSDYLSRIYEKNLEEKAAYREKLFGNASPDPLGQLYQDVAGFGRGSAAPIGGGMGTVSPDFLAQAQAIVDARKAENPSIAQWNGQMSQPIPQQMPPAQAPGPPLDLAAASQAPGQPLQLGGLPPEIQARGITPQQPQLPIPPQAAPQLTPQSPDLGDRLSAGFQSFAQTAHGPPLAALSNLIQGISTGRRTDPQGVASTNREGMTRAIFSALKQNDPKMPDQQAMLIATASATDPKLAEKLLPQALGLEPPKTAEELAVRKMFQADRQNNVAGTGGTVGVNGAAAASAIPTTVQGIMEWKQNQDAERARKIKAAEQRGELEGKTAANLPKSLGFIDTALQTIEQARNHPGRKWYSTGLLGDLPTPGGTEGRGFSNLIGQIKGQVFLDAYETLKGGGQITQIEGEKAERAKSRIDRATKYAELESAFNDLRDALIEGRRKLAQTAGIAPMQQTQSENWRIRKVPQ